MKTDLEKLSYAELLTLQEEVEKRKKTAATEERAKLKSEILALINSRGFTFAEIFTSPSPKPPAKIKYVDPGNSANVWSGRGKRPKWVEEALAGGKSLETIAA